MPPRWGRLWEGQVRQGSQERSFRNLVWGVIRQTSNCRADRWICKSKVQRSVHAGDTDLELSTHRLFLKLKSPIGVSEHTRRQVCAQGEPWACSERAGE